MKPPISELIYRVLTPKEWKLTLERKELQISDESTTTKDQIYFFSIDKINETMEPYQKCQNALFLIEANPEDLGAVKLNHIVSVNSPIFLKDILCCY